MSEGPELRIDSLGDWVRTHDCGALRAADEGKEALLMGWVNGRRDLGNLIFVDLRDREGTTQIVFDPLLDAGSHGRAHILRNEWVVAVKGKVSLRQAGQANPGLPTGEVELKVTDLRILNRTETPPFQVDGIVDASETLRLKYRYLELRRPQVFAHFRMRHRIAALIRDHLNRLGFIEVETPFLTRSTPEGARDYLVPSRVNKGMFYALPQSPQLFKQILMIAGFDRYYQIVRCFRDEDLRADRQPEFTQVDLEMAFSTEALIMETVEEMICDVFLGALGHRVPRPIPRMAYREAMDRFGSDKPDLRYDLELRDVSEIAGRTEFGIFKKALAEGGVVKGINLRGQAASFSRKALDELAAVAVQNGARGLSWVKVGDGTWQSALEKFFGEAEKRDLERGFDAGPRDLIVLAADRREIVNQALGALRVHLGARLGLQSADRYALVWITAFPLFEKGETEGKIAPMHHPFTSPLEEDLPLLEIRPQDVRARAYDLVLNGSEIGGGSVRIHDPLTQERIFRVLGLSIEEAQSKFGFFLEALRYGAPPHAGMALGFDRLVAIMAGLKSIREVIAFPKTTSAACPLTNAPSPVGAEQLRDLGLAIIEDQ